MHIIGLVLFGVKQIPIFICKIYISDICLISRRGTSIFYYRVILKKSGVQKHALAINKCSKTLIVHM